MERVTFKIQGNEVVVRTTAMDANGGEKFYENKIALTAETADAARSGQLAENDLLRQIRAAWQVFDEAHTADMAGSLLVLTGTRDEVRNYLAAL